jgi:CheY-like chemotaxis protein
VIMASLAIDSQLRIAVVDDDDDGRDELMDNLRDWNFEPVAVTGQYGENLDDLVSAIQAQQSSFVICDNRLQTGGLAAFYGTSVVERLVRIGMPAMLLTMYQSNDQLNLRAHRHAMPVVVGRHDFQPELVPTYLEICSREIRLDPVEERKPHRVLIRVEAVSSGSHGVRIDALIPSWSPDRALTIPSECIEPSLVSGLARGVRLFGEVNIRAEREEDLFFRNVNQVAPEPREF